MNPKAYSKITPQEAKRRMDCIHPLVILDIRTVEEFKKGHITGAILAEPANILERIECLVPDKSVPLLLYCKSGVRSQIAALNLIEFGYTDVADFGGILDWPYEITT